ncbi:DUF4390 domain-containing protein [Marinicella sp. S1101]|uniref:DUF4390 domain-containing protein n=1 Tax=Marinicella marina TaxID=2996016 RepID=UPI002260A61E|nr:DUF4390 domain-containing protein [Marinicella marina]MCX7552878.1 DUF4390 domain-containing protein [Marinicella marina]MDJ1139813.1 DUF4390 domain-containing protein [Marinicella marina]
MKKILTSVVLAMLLTWLHNSQAANIIRAEQSIQGQQLIIKPIYQLPISDKVVEAIDNGIVITFVMQVKLYQGIDWWFDTVISAGIKTFQVRYFSLGGLYQLHNIKTDEKLSFVSLDELLNHLGQEINFQFQLSPSVDYFETRIFLDKQALPSIMQLPNVFDQDWNFNSDWQRFDLAPAPTEKP